MIFGEVDMDWQFQHRSAKGSMDMAFGARAGIRLYEWRG